MKPSDALRNLRSGAVVDASGVFSGTMRAWIRNNDLQLGDRATLKSGNPRYSLIDAARLILMRFLTEKQNMQAAAAAAIVNAAAPYLNTLSEIELNAIDAPASVPASPRFILQSIDGSCNPEIKTYAELGVEESGRGLIVETRIDLREAVRYARDQLLGALNIEMGGLSHHFADTLPTSQSA